jgi:hypothetical protein
MADRMSLNSTGTRKKHSDCELEIKWGGSLSTLHNPSG